LRFPAPIAKCGESGHHPPVCGSLGRWPDPAGYFALILNAIFQKSLCLPTIVEQAVWPGEDFTGPNALTEESVPCDCDVCFA
jgi:hypothetical protein